MNPVYKFRWRRHFFWHSVLVTGHKFEEGQNKMILYLQDGSLREIKHWLDCECELGSDWVNLTKEAIKEEAGQG